MLAVVRTVAHTGEQFDSQSGVRLAFPGPGVVVVAYERGRLAPQAERDDVTRPALVTGLLRLGQRGVLRARAVGALDVTRAVAPALAEDRGLVVGGPGTTIHTGRRI